MKKKVILGILSLFFLIACGKENSQLSSVDSSTENIPIIESDVEFTDR